jgi:L-arabinokinase
MMPILDLDRFLTLVRERSSFTRSAPVVVARAPGRLDVMGGIADYSGSLVLQRPIAEATFAAVQPDGGKTLRIVSLGNAGSADRMFSLDLDSFLKSGAPISYSDARDFFRGSDHWAGYVVGAFLVLMRERGIEIPNGARILIASSVPEGKGVASSAALEVATMLAVASAFGIKIPGPDLAVLCQKVENHVAGAPCGLMDQMTSVIGDAKSLMVLLCQPAQLQASLHIPNEVSFWGLDSGERHAVTGSDYESVRTGAFMGYRMMCESEDPGNGYLANVSPEQFEREFAGRLPEEMSGEEFLKHYSGTKDSVTTVKPDRTYKIQRPTAHPIYEHARVQRFRQLLPELQSEEHWTLLGELMYQSHASYSACGLGSPGTDAIVRLVREAGRSSGLYGARITGGGSGGTVAILGRRDAEGAVREVADAYAERTGHRPHVFAGSSAGAAAFGTIKADF